MSSVKVMRNEKYPLPSECTPVICNPSTWSYLRVKASDLKNPVKMMDRYVRVFTDLQDIYKKLDELEHYFSTLEGTHVHVGDYCGASVIRIEIEHDLDEIKQAKDKRVHSFPLLEYEEYESLSGVGFIRVAVPSSDSMKVINEFIKSMDDELIISKIKSYDRILLLEQKILRLLNLFKFYFYLVASYLPRAYTFHHRGIYLSKSSSAYLSSIEPHHFELSQLKLNISNLSYKEYPINFTHFTYLRP